MYSISSHGRMIRDEPRMQAYVDALRETVSAGSVVLDLGAGTGILSLIACQLGARKVFAVELSNVIHLGKEIAAANGFGEKIEFIQGDSSKITLPEPADLIVSDVRGVLPFFRGGLVSLIDARRRFLAPGGKMIPRADTIWAAVAETSELYDKVTSPWKDGRFGFNLRAGLRYTINSWQKGIVSDHQLLTDPALWASLDYSKIDEPSHEAELQWTVKRAGIGHGLSLWFDSDLAGGVHLSNSPHKTEMIYGQAFFPWEKALPLAEGETVKTKISARLVGSDYVWNWETTILDHLHNKPRVQFKQSTFQSDLFAPDELRKAASNYVPQLNGQGEIDAFIIARINGMCSIGKIAQDVATHFPNDFPNIQLALSKVARLSQLYSE